MKSLICWLIVALPLTAADPTLMVKSDKVPLPTTLAAGLQQSFAPEALVVRDAKGTLATFWLRHDLALTLPPEHHKTGLNYQTLPPTTLVGIVALARTWLDYHQQECEAGVYTLRLAIQPKSKDHEGTAPHREFCILSPLAKDMKTDVLPLKMLIAQSGTITGGTHPVVMLLYPQPKPNAAPTIVRFGKAGQALTTTLRIQNDKQQHTLGIAFNLLGTGTDE